MLLKNKSPDPGKEKFKTVIVNEKNLKYAFNCLKLDRTVCFPVLGYVCMLYSFVTSFLGVCPSLRWKLLWWSRLWCQYFGPLEFSVYARKHELKFNLLEQLCHLGNSKGRKDVGNGFTNRELLYLCVYSCQWRLWSESAFSVLAESWHRPWYFSWLFQAWIETTVPVLTLDDYWNDSK